MIKNSLKIKNLKFKIIGLLVVLVCIGSILAQNASADSQSFSISPPSQAFTLSLGQTQTNTMLIRNNSTFTQIINFSTKDFIVKDHKGTPLLTDASNNPFSATSYISLQPSTIVLAPQQTQKITYAIKVPLDASPGGHYAAILATSNIKQGEAAFDAGTAVEAQLGSLISLRVKGTAIEKAIITDFHAPSFSEYGPITVTGTIRNLGNIHVMPQGNIIISDMLGRKVQTVKLLEHNIFPSASRDYSAILGQKYMIGRFKAEVIAYYGNKNSLSQSVYFWVIPWELITLSILLLVVIVLVAIAIQRRFKKPLALEEKE